MLDELRQLRTLPDPLPDRQGILSAAAEKLSAWTRPSLQPVINASGVILHTNLGRAPLSQAALQAIQNTSRGYTNLEYSLSNGKRGTRSAHTEDLLTHLTGAEAALVVNNNAAALLLILSALAHRRRVIISRTQLVEIGGEDEHREQPAGREIPVAGPQGLEKIRQPVDRRCDRAQGQGGDIQGGIAKRK